MKTFFLCLWALCLVSMHLFGWTNGELLIWMDPDRGLSLKPLAQKFHDDFGINATIETPQNITDSFPLAAQVAKGPDIGAHLRFVKNFAGLLYFFMEERAACCGR